MMPMCSCRWILFAVLLSAPVLLLVPYVVAEQVRGADASPVVSSEARAGEYDTVIVPKLKTSIYIGSVSLTLAPLRRGGNGAYAADYKASVVPFFFYNEAGRFQIDFTDEHLAQLARGERVMFKGNAKSTGGDERRIEGHATPASPGAKTGKIKVRLFVGAKTRLVFDSTYAFAETERN